MKEFYLANIRPGDEILDFFMVKSKAIKVGSNQKKYFDVMIGDKTGEMPAKKWDVSPEEEPNLEKFNEGDIVRIKGLVTEWNGQRQVRIGKIRKAVESDGIDFEDYVKAAPEKGEDMYRFVLDKAQAIKDDDLRRLCVKLLTENEEKLLYYPAAQKNHHAQRSGLLYHVKRMLMTGERICEVYTILNKDLVMAGVILHDIEKLNEIESNELGMSPGYSLEGQLLGHLVQGVKMLDRVCRELDFPKEKALLLEHMVLAHHYEPEYGSPKKPLFPEAEILHYLDIIDAHMFDIEAALTGVADGEFSDKVWTLDNRRFYKYTL